MKPRPTEAEFDELKRRRDESVRKSFLKICEEQGWDPEKATFHASHSEGCYCACPEGPCQHEWDGPEYIGEEGCLHSATCSRCGAVAAYHDMRCGP
jgi:hypothetical protein